MAIAQRQIAPPRISYEQYLHEGLVEGRYDIVDGERIFMPGPTRLHQRIVGYLYRRLFAFEVISRSGQALQAPLDVLIRRRPLRTRQPDALFISHGRLAENGPADATGPLSPAPELVMEVLSPSETVLSREDKIRDYADAGVQECWVIDLSRRRVEVLALAPGDVRLTGAYSDEETARSHHFPGLEIPVSEVFEGA